MTVHVGDLPREVKDAVVYSARNWPKALTAEQLLSELNTLAHRVYVLAVTAATPSEEHKG